MVYYLSVPNFPERHFHLKQGKNFLPKENNKLNKHRFPQFTFLELSGTFCSTLGVSDILQ